MMTSEFYLSSRSIKNLSGVHPELILVVGRAIQITPVDFTVLEGLRKLDRQRELYASGASKTMRSRHLTGDAVDLGAWVGEVRWDMNLYYQIAAAMRDAAMELDIPIEWGACWKLINACDDLPAAVAEYAAWKRTQNKKPFIDAPHFQRPTTA